MRRNIHLRAGRRLTLLMAVSAAAAIGANVLADFKADCDALTRDKHRLTGSDEYRRAADYAAGRLREIGADEVVLQPFGALKLVAGRCEMTEGTNTIRLLPMRPNGIIPPVTPENGIAGVLVNAGRGSPAEFPDEMPAHPIVVMDYNCGLNWINAFGLGAGAVIFVGGGAAEARNAHSTELPANLPRFYYEGPRESLPFGKEVCVYSEATWQPAVGINVFGYFKGTKPVFDEKTGPETIVMAAGLSSFGDVPQRTPGARLAANCAGVLRVAEKIAKDRPARNMLAVFLDADANSHQGVCMFYRIFETINKNVELGRRAVFLENEEKFLNELKSLAGNPDYLKVATGDLRLELLRRMNVKAAEEVNNLNMKLQALRTEIHNLRKNGRTEEAARAEAETASLDRIKQEWNSFRRALARQNVPANLLTYGDKIREAVCSDTRQRMAELAETRETLRAEQKLRDLVGKTWISLHASFMVGDITERWGLIFGGLSRMRSASDVPGVYTAVQKAFLSCADKARRNGNALPGFETGTLDFSLAPADILCAAPRFTHSGDIAGRLGIYNVVLGTVQENLRREGTPDDTPNRLNLKAIEKQFDEIALIMKEAGDTELLSLARSIRKDALYLYPSFENNRIDGSLVMTATQGSAIPGQRVPNAIIQAWLYPGRGRIFPTDFAYAYNDYMSLRTDQNGTFMLGPVTDSKSTLRGFAAVFDSRGEVSSASALASTTTIDTRINVLRCRHGNVALPFAMSWLPETKVLDGFSNGNLPLDKSYYEPTDNFLCWYSEEKVKTVKLFESPVIVALGNGPENLTGKPAETSAGEGAGLSMLKFERPDVYRRSASDLWRLDESRMNILRRRGIMNQSIEELHGRAEDLCIDAGQTDSTAQGQALAASSFMMQYKVYTATRSTLDDIIKAVLILLGLCVPFAFALERLLIGATSVYRQIGGFVAFFAATFVILFFTHPAFAISSTPIIIFLGFAIIVLSSMVISIIMGRFQVELKIVQGMESTVHAADISRFNTIMAAMSMGISTMRRRPLRTVLTAVTITLLTFTILCFASFGTQTAVLRFYRQSNPAYAGTFFHNVMWTRLADGIREIVSGRWSKDVTVCARYWVSPEKNRKNGVLMTRADGTSPVVFRGVLGLEYPELARRRDIAEAMGLESGIDPAAFSNTVWVTASASERLKVRAGDSVIVGGCKLTMGAPLNVSRLSNLRDMDGNSILPVDFEQLTSVQSEQIPLQALAEMGPQNWKTVPLDQCVIVSDDAARRMGATLRGITIYTPDTTVASSISEELASFVALPIAGTRTDGVYLHVLGSALLASGLADLFFPILLGGLVVFGTMLGSVADREKEIYTFSALGLAPPHVAGLFLSEAMVYSVIGGVGGYLLSQLVMKLLNLLASFGLVQVPEINYSSTNAIVTILMVMATVLLSAIYPAYRASKSANPGVLRSWKLPPAEGDTLSLIFPFTVSEYDITGLVSFLKEHFDTFADTGVGAFTAKQTRLTVDAGKRLGLTSILALAPFDLGVTQDFVMTSVPSEIPGIDEVSIRIQRVSGEPGDWHRLNRVLLDDLRKQFLIWRSLPSATMEMYRQRTLTATGVKHGIQETKT